MQFVTLVVYDVISHSSLPHGSTVDARGARVTSMLLQPHPHSVMWVGLGSGYLLLISAPSHNPLMAVRRHVDAIRSLQCLRVTGQNVYIRNCVEIFISCAHRARAIYVQAYDWYNECACDLAITHNTWDRSCTPKMLSIALDYEDVLNYMYNHIIIYV